MPPQVAQRLALEICRLLVDEGRANQLGTEVVRRAGQFRSDNVARSIEKIYGHVLAG